MKRRLEQFESIVGDLTHCLEFIRKKRTSHAGLGSIEASIRNALTTLVDERDRVITLEVFDVNGEIEELDIVAGSNSIKDYLFKKLNPLSREVWLIGENPKELIDDGIDEINATSLITADIDMVFEFIKIARTERVFVMAFKSVSDAFEVMQYFNEGHPQSGEILIPESRLQTHQSSLAN